MKHQFQPRNPCPCFKTKTLFSLSRHEHALWHRRGFLSRAGLLDGSQGGQNPTSLLALLQWKLGGAEPYEFHHGEGREMGACWWVKVDGEGVDGGGRWGRWWRVGDFFVWGYFFGRNVCVCFFDRNLLKGETDREICSKSF